MRAPGAARLVTLTAIVVALAAAVGITGGPRATVERPLLVPGFDPATVTKIELGGSPPITVAIDDSTMNVIAPVPGPADESTVRDLLSAIASARADRVVHRKVTSASTVRIERRGQPPLAIELGESVPASGQTWLGIGDRAYLVPSWVSAALVRDLTSLRRRQPFPPVAITGVEIHGKGVDLVLAGSPLRRRDEGTSVRVARAAVARLDAALGAIVLDTLVAGDTSRTELTVRVLGGAAPYELFVHGACPSSADHVLVSGSAGVGCIPSALVDDVVAAAAALAGAAGIEPTLALDGTEIETITDGTTTLARRGAGWRLTLGDETVDADDDKVEEMLRMLGTAGTPGPLPTTAPIATWTVTLTGGTSETWRWYAHAIRRDDEPTAIQIGEAWHEARRALGPRLRNLSLLVIDATLIRSIEAKGLHPGTLERGALVGEWVPAATPAATELVTMLATFRGLRWLDARDLGAIRRTIVVNVDAPPIPGEPATTHTIAVGAPRDGDRCAVRVDSYLPIEMSTAECAALLAPLGRPNDQ